MSSAHENTIGDTVHTYAAIPIISDHDALVQSLPVESEYSQFSLSGFELIEQAELSFGGFSHLSHADDSRYSTQYTDKAGAAAGGSDQPQNHSGDLMLGTDSITSDLGPWNPRLNLNLDEISSYEESGVVHQVHALLLYIKLLLHFFFEIIYCIFQERTYRFNFTNYGQGDEISKIFVRRSSRYRKTEVAKNRRNILFSSILRIVVVG